MPDISVIIPAYREEKVIGTVVAWLFHVLEKTFRDSKILIIIDANSNRSSNS